MENAENNFVGCLPAAGDNNDAEDAEDADAATVVGAGAITGDEDDNEDDDIGIETGAGEEVACVGDVKSKPDKNASNDGFDVAGVDDVIVVGVMTGAETGVVALAKSANKSMFADDALVRVGCNVGCIACCCCCCCCGFDGPPKKSPNKSLI